jgi:hypothetical protein
MRLAEQPARQPGAARSTQSFCCKGKSVKRIKFILIIIFGLGGPAVAETYEQAEIYTDLRKQVLSLTKDQLGKDVPVLAVLMETGYPEAVATLIAVADGASSLYFSNGGGIIGAGEYKQVHDSSLALVSKAGDYLNKLTLTSIFPLPKKGFTRFYVVTPSGIYTDEVLEDDLGNDSHMLSPVFFQGHELISYIRTAEEHRSAEQGAPADR